MDIELIGGISAVIIIIGLVEIAKNVFHVETKFAPVLAVILGLAVSFGYQFYADTAIFEAIIKGLAVGLASVGLYSGTKNVKEGVGE